MGKSGDGASHYIRYPRHLITFDIRDISMNSTNKWGQISTFNIDSVFIWERMNHGEAIEDSISRGELTRRQRGGIVRGILPLLNYSVKGSDP